MQNLLPDLKEIKLPSEAEMRKAKMGSSIARKQELIALLAANPDQRQQILTDWHGAFPADEWIKEQNGTLRISEGGLD